jgi:hypothetical protein
VTRCHEHDHRRDGGHGQQERSGLPQKLRAAAYLSHIWTIWPYKATGTDKTSDTQNLLRNIAAWSTRPTNDFLTPWPSCEANIPPRSPACLPASVVLRPMSRLSSTSPPAAILPGRRHNP